jgi:hypothetical protein
MHRIAMRSPAILLRLPDRQPAARAERCSRPLHSALEFLAPRGEQSELQRREQRFELDCPYAAASARGGATHGHTAVRQSRSSGPQRTYFVPAGQQPPCARLARGSEGRGTRGGARRVRERSARLMRALRHPTSATYCSERRQDETSPASRRCADIAETRPRSAPSSSSHRPTASIRLPLLLDTAAPVLPVAAARLWRPFASALSPSVRSTAPSSILARLPMTSAASCSTDAEDELRAMPSAMPSMTPNATTDTMFSSQRVKLPTARRAMENSCTKNQCVCDCCEYARCVRVEKTGQEQRVASTRTCASDAKRRSASTIAAAHERPMSKRTPSVVKARLDSAHNASSMTRGLPR